MKSMTQALHVDSSQTQLKWSLIIDSCSGSWLCIIQLSDPSRVITRLKQQTRIRCDSYLLTITTSISWGVVTAKSQHDGDVRSTWLSVVTSSHQRSNCFPKNTLYVPCCIAADEAAWITNKTRLLGFEPATDFLTRRHHDQAFLIEHRHDVFDGPRWYYLEKIVNCRKKYEKLFKCKIDLQWEVVFTMNEWWIMIGESIYTSWMMNHQSLMMMMMMIMVPPPSATTSGFRLWCGCTKPSPPLPSW